MTEEVNKYSSIVAKLTAKIKDKPDGGEAVGVPVAQTDGGGYVGDGGTQQQVSTYVEGGDQSQYVSQQGGQTGYVDGGQAQYTDGTYPPQTDQAPAQNQYYDQQQQPVDQYQQQPVDQYQQQPVDQYQQQQQPVDQYQQQGTDQVYDQQQIPVDQYQQQAPPVTNQYQDPYAQQQPAVDPYQQQPPPVDPYQQQQQLPVDQYQQQQQQPPVDPYQQQQVVGDYQQPVVGDYQQQQQQYQDQVPPVVDQVPPVVDQGMGVGGGAPFVGGESEVVEFPSDVYGGGVVGDGSMNKGEVENLGEESEPYTPTQPPNMMDQQQTYDAPQTVDISPVNPPSAPMNMGELDNVKMSEMPSVICEGYMTKCGSFVKNWKLRYFKLTKDGSLAYYKKKDGKAIKSFNIKGMKFRHCPVAEKKKPNCINIFLAKKKFFFFGETENDYNRWVKGLIRGLSMFLANEAVIPRGLPPGELENAKEDEYLRIQEMLMKQYQYRRTVDGDVDPAMRKSIYKNAALEEENRRRMKTITLYNWFLHFDFLKHHDDLVHYNETKNPGLFVFTLFKSFVEAMELIGNNHKDCLKFITEQCTHRRVVIEFVKSHYEDGTGPPPSVEEEVEGEVQKAKVPEPFLMLKLKDGQIYIEFLKFRPSFENPTIGMMDIARLFHNDQQIRLDSFLNIKMVADKNKEDSKLMLKNITKIDFDIQIDYAALVQKVPETDPNIGKLFEVITTRHLKSFVDGIRLLFNHEQKDFIQKRMAKYIPSKIITFDFVTDLKEGVDVEVRLRAEKLIICCRERDTKWLGNPEKVLRDEQMYATLFTDFSMELPILLEEDVQKKEEGFQKKYGDRLEGMTGEKWTFKHDWMEIVGWFKKDVTVDENTPGLTEKDLCTLCSIIYENHVKNLIDGIETMLNQDEEGVCKAALLKHCTKRQVSFSFVEKQETPGCEKLFVGGELDGEGVLWITVELDGTKRKWVEKALNVLTNPNLLMEIIGNSESPPLVIQLHMKKALPAVIDVKKNFNDFLREKGVQRATDGPMKISNSGSEEVWDVQIDWEKMYYDLKAADVRIRGFGNTVKKYLSLLVTRVKAFVQDQKDVRGKKRFRFKEVFHKKIVKLEFVGQEGMQDQEFRYCGIVNQGDGILYIGVKGWRVNNNEMGSRTNDLAKIMKE